MVQESGVALRMSTSLPGPLLEFAELFNRGAFWESHEVLERPWRQDRSAFYKGLILYASAWVHVQRGNPRGIEAQLRKAMAELSPFAPAYLGVDVAVLLAHGERVRSIVRRRQGAPAARWEELVPAPELRLCSDHLRGDERELLG